MLLLVFHHYLVRRHCAGERSRRSLSLLLSNSRAAEAITGCGPASPRCTVVIIAERHLDRVLWVRQEFAAASATEAAPARGHARPGPHDSGRGNPGKVSSAVMPIYGWDHTIVSVS
jgi:hypothetical protein